MEQLYAAERRPKQAAEHLLAGSDCGTGSVPCVYPSEGLFISPFSYKACLTDWHQVLALFSLFFFFFSLPSRCYEQHLHPLEMVLQFIILNPK